MTPARAVAAGALMAPLPASAAVFVGVQVVETHVTGTGAAPFDQSGSDAGTRASTVIAAVRAPAGGAATGTSSVVASLIGAERGRITFRRTLAVDAPGSAVSAVSSYVYLFTADTPTALELNWGVSAYGGADPAQVATLRDRADGRYLFTSAPLGDGASGTTTLTFAPGSYEFRVEDAAPIATGGAATAGLSSQYSFAMRAIPEPATWALMIAGFGTVGMTLRRRRRVAVR